MVMIIGVDEVGRGCWAGPLVVAAVALGGTEIKGLTDSKKLTRAQREALALQVRHHAQDIGIGWISNRLIDKYGLSWALTQATKQALVHTHHSYDEIIIDGTVNFIKDSRVTTLPKADALVPSVSAASIIAKVARDNYMRRVHHAFPDYGFASHVGYGTVAHQTAIRRLGPTPLHRLSWAPLKDLSIARKEVKGLPNLQQQTSGYKAESVAQAFLEGEGFEIIGRNWRTKWCEIDLIVQKDGVIHFVEVKYRRTAMAGTALEAITPKKLQQMRFAAELWRTKHAAQAPSQLSALALEGADMTVMAWHPLV